MIDTKLNTITEAIEDLKQGKVIIVVDDEDRENEGDFICAAECVTPEIINFMATHGRGLICTPISEERADQLELYPMVPQNTSMHETAFTISIDYLLEGCTTGISAYDRATGIRALVKPETKSSDYARPGHIFPLRAKEGGVLRRSGHTEAAVDLSVLAGFSPCGVLVEILNEDGSMARMDRLQEIAAEHDIKIISIEDLISFRIRNEKLVKKIAEYDLPSTAYGPLQISVFRQMNTQDDHLVITLGTWSEDETVPVRVQSSSGINNLEHLFPGKEKSDIDAVLAKMKNLGKGIFVIMRHAEKMDSLIPTIESLLGNQQKPQDINSTVNRDIGIGAQILLENNVKKINLLTNSEWKGVGLEGFGISIESIEPY